MMNASQTLQNTSLKRYAAYKDSGVEWIGEIPAHWSMPPMYSRFKIAPGKMLDAKRITGKNLISYLRNTDVQWGEINYQNLSKMDISPEEYERYTVRMGDLLICEGGEIGRAAIWNYKTSEVIGFQKALHRLRPFDKSKEHSQYMFYMLKCAADAKAFQLTAKTNTILHLTGEMLKALRFPTPPLEEQIKIANYLNHCLTHINHSINHSKLVINSLQKYKQTLIAHAVTGKIKVS